MEIVHPEYAMLVLEINDLKEQIAEMIVERDMLNFYTCTDIEMDYMLKIGSIEYNLVQIGNKYRKNLRKLEIIEEKQKKKLPINMTYINRKINNEFKAKMEIESHMSKDIDLAIEMSELEPIDQDLLEEMNLAYSKLQMMYNPIFDLKTSDEKEKNYKKIEKYYRKGNLKKLNKLAEDYDENEIFQDEMVNMKYLKSKYIEILNVVQKQIRKIKNSFPYNQRVILEDENLCRRKKDALHKDIREVNVQNKKLEKKIEKKLNKLT